MAPGSNSVGKMLVIVNFKTVSCIIGYIVGYSVSIHSIGCTSLERCSFAKINSKEITTADISSNSEIEIGCNRHCFRGFSSAIANSENIVASFVIGFVENINSVDLLVFKID